MKTEDIGARKIELNQLRSKPDTVDRHVRTARTIVHHYAQNCSTETILLISPFLQTNITSEMWPSGSNGEFVALRYKSVD